MFDKREFDEFIGEISYLNESTKALIKEIKEADSMSINLKDTLKNLETVSKSLNYEINNAISSNLDKQMKIIIDNHLKEFVNKSKYIKDISISISQTIDILNRSSKKIEKHSKYHILESIFYMVFFVAGAFLQESFKILNF
jgi:hypothetical protein